MCGKILAHYLQYGKQFVVSMVHSLTDLICDTVDIFESSFDTAIMQLTVNKMKKYAQQKILRSSCPLACHFRLK